MCGNFIGNIFSIKEDINVVDLPGYGYANLSKIRREEFINIKSEIKSYLY